tara:strand:+ start:592 stop:1407 length:816 start_codon:yes stop_codon:yes gene_type:complete
MNRFFLSTLSQNEINDFNRDGFLIKRKCIEISKINNVIKTFFNLCANIDKNKFSHYSPENIFANDQFSKDLITFRKNSPKIFGAIYDTMQTTVSMQELGLNEIASNDISILLNTSKSNLMCFNYLFRMDPPFSNKNKLDWHQDFVSYDQEDMSDGITAWFPLMNISGNIGPLKALVGSHKIGKVKNYAIKTEKIEANTSHKHEIDKSILNDFEEVHLPVNVGDAIYVSMNLLHASGDNTSKKIRFSGQGRYFNILSKNFPMGRTQFQKSLI